MSGHFLELSFIFMVRYFELAMVHVLIGGSYRKSEVWHGRKLSTREVISPMSFKPYKFGPLPYEHPVQSTLYIN